MASICFYFQVHQPLRIRRYSIFDVGKSSDYFSAVGREPDNLQILKKVSKKCYLPANEHLLELLREHKDFRFSFSISGILLEQLRDHLPEVLDSFIKLAKTGQVEILSETYYHSLAFLHSKEEFFSQIKQHLKIVEEVFAVTPKVFRNTELIYSNDLAKSVEEFGFKGMLLEGADRILGEKSPNYLYKAMGTKSLKLLLRNYRLSDDIAFRFSNPHWEEHPLDAAKYAKWVSAINGAGEVVNLFMDFETFGEHHWEEAGIFEFLKKLPAELKRHADNNFVTCSQALSRFQARDILDVPDFVSWADIERDLSAWLSNPMQADAMKKLYALEGKVLSSNDEELIRDWRRLQTSDHFYYMCTKWFADGDVHKYFNPYESPYEAFINFMNVLSDLKLRMKASITRSATKSKFKRHPSRPRPEPRSERSKVHVKSKK
jgi:alpha-amylase